MRAAYARCGLPVEVGLVSPGELATVHDGGMATELFAFKFFDPIRGRWIHARYKATREEIAARYLKWEITGPGWTPADVGGSFVPFVAEMGRGKEPTSTEPSK